MEKINNSNLYRHFNESNSALSVPIVDLLYVCRSFNVFKLVLLFCLAWNQSAQADFFSTSTRRNLRASELGSIVSLSTDKGNCTGFRVKNDQGRLYIATARHCFDYQATLACKESRFLVGTMGDPAYLLDCLRIIAASTEDDMMIFEAEVRASTNKARETQKVLNFLEAYSLADYYPALYTGLQMIGLPADKYNNVTPIMSENCNVQPQALDVKGFLAAPAGTPELKPDIGFHNCNVYGGNSGGPIKIRNSADVVAMPSAYYPGVYEKGSYYNAAAMELTKGFVDRNRETLVKAGVHLSRAPVRKNGTYHYLASVDKIKTYFQMGEPSFQFRINQTDWALGTLEASFSTDHGKTFGPSFKFQCEDDKGNTHFCVYQENNQEKYGKTWVIETMPEKVLHLVITAGGQKTRYELSPQSK